MDRTSMASRAVARTIKGWIGGVLLGAMAAVQAGTPYPRASTPPAQDVGALDLVRGSAPLTVTVALKLRDGDQLQSLATAIHTVGSPQFHRFLTPAEFHQRFDPKADAVAAAVAHFNQAGLSARVDSGNLLRVTGPAQAMQKAFAAPLHVFDVAAHGNNAGYRFHAPIDSPRLASAAVAANVDAIIGLDDRPRFRPHLRQSPLRAAPLATRAAAAARNAMPGNPPGDWTVTDLARYYNVQPLYDRGLHGEGQTLGIVTLASFTPSDAFGYWAGLGLSVHANRLKVVDIDGGPGAPSDASGSDETTLDVEQSGGIAPAAKIVVYQSPNTDQGFFDAFVRAVNDNSAETVSTSWGEWEGFDTQSDVNVGKKGRSVELLQAFSNLFLQAAVQGQSFFAASGDDGAYDINDPALFGPPAFSKVLSVDSPSSSAWITASGGTTLAGDQSFQLSDGSVVTVNVPVERVWGWDYLTGLCATLGLDPISCGIFPAGGGGGVSAFVPAPFYQALVPLRTTEPGQTLVDETTSPPTPLVTLPAHFHGRNLPDVSLNADPDTGYIIAYTSDQQGFGILEFTGGTSFVAPQLNGIAALLGQHVKGRLGLFNVPLYLLAATPLGYVGPAAPLRDIKAGNNWFYTGHAGYDQGSGVGTLDVANLARALDLLGY